MVAGYARGGWIARLLGLFGALVMGSAGVLLTAAPADAAPVIHAAPAPMTLCLKLSGQTKTVCQMTGVQSAHSSGRVYVNVTRTKVTMTTTLVVKRGALQCLWNLPSDYHSHAYVCGPIGAGVVTVTTMGDPASFDASVAYPTMIGAN